MNQKEDGDFQWEYLVSLASKKGPGSVEWSIVNAAVHSCWSEKLKSIVEKQKFHFDLKDGCETKTKGTQGGYVVEWPDLIETASKLRFMTPIPKWWSLNDLHKRFGKKYIDQEMNGIQPHNTFVIMCQMLRDGPPPILFCLTAIC